MLTVKLRSTGAAAANNALPVWVARIVQVPWATKVTVAPLAVHVDNINEAKATGKAEEAVALTLNGGELTALLLSGANAIV